MTNPESHQPFPLQHTQELRHGADVQPSPDPADLSAEQPRPETNADPVAVSRLRRCAELVGGCVLATVAAMSAWAAGPAGRVALEQWQEVRSNHKIIAENSTDSSQVQREINSDLEAKTKELTKTAKHNTKIAGSFGVAAFAGAIGSGFLFVRPKPKQAPRSKTKASDQES